MSVEAITCDECAEPAVGYARIIYCDDENCCPTMRLCATHLRRYAGCKEVDFDTWLFGEQRRL
jgi:hypothetical protein